MSGWLACAALVAVAVWVLRRVLAGYPASSLGTLAPREAAFVAAASEAMFPPGGEIPESGIEAGIPQYIDGYLAAVPPRQRLLMRSLFFLMEHVTLFFGAPGRGGRRRFSALSQTQRQAALEGWRTSPSNARRTVFMALRSLLTMGYFGCPAVLQRLELSPMDIPTPVIEADLLYPPVGRARDGVLHTELAPDPAPVLGADAPVHPDFRTAPR